MTSSYGSTTVVVSSGGDSVVMRPDRELVVGRGPGADFVVDDLTVAPRHAVLRWRAGRWELADLDSPNGLWVDGARRPDVVVDRQLVVGLGSPNGVLLHLAPVAGDVEPPVVPRRRRRR